MVICKGKRNFIIFLEKNLRKKNPTKNPFQDLPFPGMAELA